jgi:hypothetical protein
MNSFKAYGNIFINFFGKNGKTKPEYWLTRFVFLRALGAVYFFAFLIAAFQAVPLIGEKGLLPANVFLNSFVDVNQNRLEEFISWPTLFWFHLSDSFLQVMAWLGVGLSFLIAIGFANGLILFFIWFLYLSFVHIGQLWYGYGWEIQLLETGFLAIFLCPILDPRPFPKSPPPILIFWLLRWLTFRIYIGAGLIKIRGDSCWRNLSCLFYHYETQPIPNFLSPFFHFMPKVIHQFGTLWNHFIELIVPFFIFGPRRWTRNFSGALLVSFQALLILSGNLSFLNWLTITATIACFDDKFLKNFLPKILIKRAEMASKEAKPQKWGSALTWAVTILVGFLSVSVIKNLLTPNQIMNASFNNLHLVNTYGAFGSIGRERRELIFKGTSDLIPTAKTIWKPYEFKVKPGDITRIPPFISPYHYRLDWQLWFAAMSRPEREPWALHLVWKLLKNDSNILSLIEKNPFPKHPPTHIKIDLYKYSFPSLNSEPVWSRSMLKEWLSPMSKSNTRLKEFIIGSGWEP